MKEEIFAELKENLERVFKRWKNRLLR